MELSRPLRPAKIHSDVCIATTGPELSLQAQRASSGLAVKEALVNYIYLYHRLV